MGQLRQVALVFSTTLPPAPLLQQLGEQFSIEERGRETEQAVYFDTFDWRLYRKQVICVGTGASLRLFAFDGAPLGLLGQEQTERFFWWDLAESETRETLRQIIDVRALLPMATLASASRHFSLLNRNRKTVVRFTLRADTPAAAGHQHRLPELLTVNELRGYQGPFDKALEICRAYGLAPLDEHRWLADRAFITARRTPLDYGEKFRVELDGDIDIGGAIATICLQLLAEMEINRNGVCEDVDSEFLHDFRIGVRRTRSLLSLLKKQFPARRHAHFRHELKWLGGITGELRDIDVYLLKKEEYLAMLPPLLAHGLDGFFADLDRRRRQEVKLLRRQLSSSRFTDLLAGWRSFLSDDGSELFTGIRKKRCRELADKTIRKRFADFLQAGDSISDDSPDSDLHNLRIQAKKLRYLLEFFRSFYDETMHDQFIQQMKKLQDNLGDFNDLSVQEQMLGAQLDELQQKNRQTLRQAAALGGLITVLAKKRQALRSMFATTYADFSSVQNKELLTLMTAAQNRQAGAE